MEILTDHQFSAVCRDLTIKNGYNLYDIALYENGRAYRYEHQPANLCNNCYSVSKMFTMTAIGMLVDDGKLSLDDKITTILEDQIHTEYDPSWNQVTVAHALAHKMGVSGMYLDIDSDDLRSYGTKDYLAYAFRRELVYKPGTVKGYSDAAYYILSRVAAQASGRRLDDFLMDRLFRPMDFAEIAWSKCPFGHPMGATGLYCRTADMLKLGVLFLNAGVFESKRYLSENWVQTAIENEFGVDKCENISYCKTGAHGQIIAFCPATQKAIALHGFNRGNYEFRGAAVREFIEK